MVFEYILKKYGMDPENDLNIITNIDFGMTAQAFAGGSGEYTVEFEPSATALEKEGSGFVVASLGIESGYGIREAAQLLEPASCPDPATCSEVYSVPPFSYL